MELEEIKQLLLSNLEVDDIVIKVDGSHLLVIAIGDIFNGMTSVKKHQYVYGPLGELISSGKLHAVTIKTFNNEQWQREKIFNQ